MNTFLQKIATGLSLALALSLSACNKEALLEPTPSGSARVGAVSEQPLPSPTLPQTPRLTKFGNYSLTYADNGKLRKVTTMVNRGSEAYSTEYTYAPGSIRAASYQGALLVRDETFTLDASGRCTESVVKVNNGETHWTYKYNPNGQLWSCQKTTTCVGGTSYTYNPEGDLIKATVATSASDDMNVTFSYLVPPMDTNYFYETYPLNVNAPLLPEHDTFLPIFGKTGKHLVKHLSYSPTGSAIVVPPSDRFYSYVIPANGYVTERNMAYTFGGLSVEKMQYEYVLGNVTLK